MLLDLTLSDGLGLITLTVPHASRSDTVRWSWTDNTDSAPCYLDLTLSGGLGLITLTVPHISRSDTVRWSWTDNTDSAPYISI